MRITSQKQVSQVYQDALAFEEEDRWKNEKRFWGVPQFGRRPQHPTWQPHIGRRDVNATLLQTEFELLANRRRIRRSKTDAMRYTDALFFSSFQLQNIPVINNCSMKRNFELGFFSKLFYHYQIHLQRYNPFQSVVADQKIQAKLKAFQLCF